MLYLLRKQIIILLGCFVLSLSISAQRTLHRESHDDWTYYFGMTLGYNQAYLHTTKHPRFLEHDSVLSVEPGASGGIALGLLGTVRITKHLQARTNPQLILGASRFFTYHLKYPEAGEQQIEKKTLPSTLISFPLQLKLNSDRIGNFRVYMLGGLKFDIDLASNSKARNAEDMIKLQKFDHGIETGIGFNFYLPFVTISPEVKFSAGLSNLHSRDANLKYSNVLEKIQSRMIVFSLHLED